MCWIASITCSAMASSPSDYSNSSGSGSSLSSGSNWSDENIGGDNFKAFLASGGYLDAYQRHEQTQEKIKWRKDLREQYLKEVVEVKAIQQFHHYSSKLRQLVQLTTNRERLFDLLVLVHAYGTEAFPEDLFKGNDAATIGTYRHKFCRVFLTAIREQEGCPALISQLEFEPSYYQGRKCTPNQPGCTKPDIYWPEYGMVFDFKNFDARVTSSEQQKWQEHLPKYGGYREVFE